MTDHQDTHTAPLPTPAAGPRMLHVAVHSIAPSLTNPRKHFDPAKLQELADSIKASGVHQPVLLRPLPPERLEDTFRAARAQGQPAPEYELVAGERRWRACQIAGVTEIPAMIRPMTDAQALEAQVIENLQREDVTELEEAEGYQILMDTVGINADEVGQRIGKSRSYVYGRLKVLALCSEARQALREKRLDFSCALEIARIPNEQLQLKALDWATATDYEGTRPSARQVQHHVRTTYTLRLEYAPFDREDAALCPAAGACSACPHRTGNQQDTESSADVCTNPPCYHAKEEAHAAQLRERAQAIGAEIITGREAKALIPSAIGGNIEGYVRLDVASDSPIKGKPLRTVLGDVLEQSGIKPTLIENPHNPTELVAVVRHDQAAELLKMAGKTEAETQLREDAARDAEAKAQQAEEEAKEQYEREWRSGTLKAIAARIRSDDVDNSAIWEEAEKAVAAYVLRTVNKAEASRLAELLELGKVAPHDSLQDFASKHPTPSNVALLALLLRDAEYTPILWKYKPDAEKNPLLHAIAKRADVDIERIKASVQANIREQLTPSRTEAQKPDLPLGPAAPTKRGAGKGKAKNGPAALAGGGGEKLSAEEASARIASAMQALGEPDQGAEAPGDDAGAVAADASQPPVTQLATEADQDPAPTADTPAADGTGDTAPGGQNTTDASTGASENKGCGADWVQPLTKACAPTIGSKVRVLRSSHEKAARFVGKEGVVCRIKGTRLEVKLPNPNPRVSVPTFVRFESDELEVL